MQATTFFLLVFPQKWPRRMLWLWLRVAAATGGLALLGACGTYDSGGLKIDRSIQAKSQNSRVEFIVLHYTASGNKTALKTLSQQNVSSHYLVTDEPTPHIYQLVDENRRAWHAGRGQWYGRTDMNAGSIGIEIVNAGGQGERWAGYPPAQIKTVATLLLDIIKRHQIKPHNIVGHSDIAPQRKVDPGPRFPWKELADIGIGRWYDPALAAKFENAFMQQGLPPISWVQTELTRTGYDAPANGILDKATKNVIAAFQMHYRPGRYDGVPDAQTLGILQALP